MYLVAENYSETNIRGHELRSLGFKHNYTSTWTEVPTIRALELDRLYGPNRTLQYDIHSDSSLLMGSVVATKGISQKE